MVTHRCHPEHPKGPLLTIQHTVVFSLQHERGSAGETEFLDTATTALTSIPEVSDFTVNEQVSAQSSLAWQFSMTFSDQAAYDAYNGHPSHVDFVESRWKTEVTAFQEFDFVARN
jgi:hypothetical protein